MTKTNEIQLINSNQSVAKLTVRGGARKKKKSLKKKKDLTIQEEVKIEPKQTSPVDYRYSKSQHHCIHSHQEHVL